MGEGFAAVHTTTGLPVAIDAMLGGWCIPTALRGGAEGWGRTESDGLCLGAAAGRVRSHVAAGEPLHRPDGEQADQNGQHIRRGLRKIDAGDAEQGRQREDERHIEQSLMDERQKQAVARCARKNRRLAEK